MSDEPRTAALLIIEEDDWLPMLLECRDTDVIRWALAGVATTMLPYWDARFVRDDQLGHVVRLMKLSLTCSTSDLSVELYRALPKAPKTRWDLSPAFEFIWAKSHDCPADFAGEAVAYAASAFHGHTWPRPFACNDLIEDNTVSAFASAKECLARLFAERDSECDAAKDYESLADDHLRGKLREFLTLQSSRSDLSRP